MYQSMLLVGQLPLFLLENFSSKQIIIQGWIRGQFHDSNTRDMHVHLIATILTINFTFCVVLIDQTLSHCHVFYLFSQYEAITPLSALVFVGQHPCNPLYIYFNDFIKEGKKLNFNSYPNSKVKLIDIILHNTSFEVKKRAKSCIHKLHNVRIDAVFNQA